MDKKSIIGLVLIFAILIGFHFINRPSEAERLRWQQRMDSIAQAKAHYEDSIRQLKIAAEAKNEIITTDSVEKDSLMLQKYGLLASVIEGNDESYVLENNLVKITISAKGGRIYSAELKDYKAYGDKPLKLFDGDANRFGFYFIHNNRNYFTGDLYFKTSGVQTSADSTQSIVLEIPMADGSLKYHYSLPKDSYALDYSIESNNLQNTININGAALDIEWDVKMPALEKSHKSEGLWSGLYYRYDDGDVEELGATGNQDESVNMNLDWIAIKNQFFSTVFVAKEKFAGAQLSSKACAETDTIIKEISTKIGVKYNFYENQKSNFQFLFIPNYFYTLESFEGMELTELLPLGWGIFGWINEWAIIPIFKFLENAFSNYGLIILLLTIIIKLVIFPFTYSSFKSQAKMRVLKPQIDEINAKIPADKPMERQQATMKLYKQAGVSPMGGCLPMLLQMPILFAAFRFFPAAVELRGESFLWADDLSTYDSILDLGFSIPFYGDHISLFCLLMCATNLAYTKFTMQTQSSQQMPGMSFMMYLMPVMLLFFFNDYPAGLCYYYFISTLITILQTVVIKAFFIDEAAILAKIESNKKRPQNGKKSKWQMRMEQLLEEQAKMQKKK